MLIQLCALDLWNCYTNKIITNIRGTTTMEPVILWNESVLPLKLERGD